MTTQIDIEAGERGGDGDVKRLARSAERRREFMGDRGRALHRRLEDGAGVEVDHLMRPRLHETDFRRAAGRETRVKCGAAAAKAMRVDKRADQSGMRKSGCRFFAQIPL